MGIPKPKNSHSDPKLVSQPVWESALPLLMAPLVGLRVEASRTLSSGVWGGNHYGDVRTTWSDTRFSDWEPRAPWFESLVEKLGGGVSEVKV